MFCLYYILWQIVFKYWSRKSIILQYIIAYLHIALRPIDPYIQWCHYTWCRTHNPGQRKCMLRQNISLTKKKIKIYN